jgi:hypothetical protein
VNRLRVLLLLTVASATAASAQPAEVTRRLALVVGANHGGEARATLRYAVEDARTFAGVLSELGGVAREDLLVLEEPTRERLLEVLAGHEVVADSLEGQGRLELLFYYSGHSDERGLLLGEEVVGYRELKAAIAAVRADVHVVVLDSCSSGVLTRLKGGAHTSPFLVDTSSRVEGYAFLTSASADEAAQESDAVGGSFFTHYLVSGLRGAADASGDGRVSLGEAYQYAFDETLRRTESTAAGPQHASYDIQLSGTGDLVMADLRAHASGLVLPAPVYGRVFVRELDGDLLAELRKRPGRPAEVRLPAGAYDVIVDDGEALMGAEVEVPAETTVALDPASMTSRERQKTVTRGDDAPSPGEAALSPRELVELRERGELMYYSGIGSVALGGCCLLAGTGGLMVDLLALQSPQSFSATNFTLASGGCAVLGGLFTAVGIPLGVLGNRKMEEADTRPVNVEVPAVEPEKRDPIPDFAY